MFSILSFFDIKGENTVALKKLFSRDSTTMTICLYDVNKFYDKILTLFESQNSVFDLITTGISSWKKFCVRK